MSDEWDSYETGPFCRHWGDPSECDEVCATCGHKCSRHDIDPDDSECMVQDCDCKKWEETE